MPRRAPLRFTTATRPALDAAKAAGAGIAVWPSRLPEGFREEAAREGVPLVRVEDGFVRSVGLGSNLFPPFSVAVDRRGIHYDPSRASDLEHLLETAAFPEALIERARSLEAFIVKAGISKYGGAAAHRCGNRGSHNAVCPAIARAARNSRHADDFAPPLGCWRPRSESNRRTRICSPLHDHSATRPLG